MANRVVYGISGVWMQLLDASDVPTGTIIKLPPAQSFEATANTEDKDVRGDNRTVASRKQFQDYDISMDVVGIDIDIVGKITGQTVGSTGTTPNVVKTLEIDPDAQRPNWQVTGQSKGDASGDVWLQFPKVQFSLPAFNPETDEYVISTIEGKAIPNASGKAVRLVDHETATAPV